MGCKQYWGQLKELDKAMTTMRRYGIDTSDPSYRKLMSLRGGLLKAPGFTVPRTISALIKIAFASPGELTLWHDVEAGWMIEVRAVPGAPPVYTAVPDDVAMDILQGRRIHEIHERYSRPVTDIDQ